MILICVVMCNNNIINIINNINNINVILLL